MDTSQYSVRMAERTAAARRSPRVGGYPRLARGVSLEQKAGLFFLIDRERSIPYELNETAFTIAQFLDGSHTAVDLARELYDRFDVSLSEAESDVRSQLAFLRELGVVTQARGLH